MKITVRYDGEYYLDQLVTSATWSGDVSQPHRTLTVSFSNTISGDDQAVNIEVGKELRFYVDGVGLFRGVVFSYSIAQDGSATIVAHDENVYLTKNTDTRKFVNMTAASIVKDICKTFGVSVGDVANTGYVIPRMILRSMTLWDMMVTALTETRKQNGRKFFVYSTGGKLYLKEKKDATVRWMLEDGVNILTANRTRSIEEMRTSVKVIGQDKESNELSASAKNADLIATYGLMQHMEQAEADSTKSQMEQLAKTRLSELGKVTEDALIEALGNTDITAGTAVYAFESMTDLIGGFYVNADSHTFADGYHRMQITISKTDDLPELDYEDNEEKKAAVKEAKKVASSKETKS
ncbi:hypothetical protein M3231_15105 [Neobacillus mesonae]|nr:hypothetical protein [Neobacillus mesonae]